MERFRLPKCAAITDMFLSLINGIQIYINASKPRLFSLASGKKCDSLKCRLWLCVQYLFRKGEAMRTYRNQTAANVKDVPFDKRQVNAVCQKVGIPKRHWDCFLTLVNENKYKTDEFHRRLDERVDYMLALLAIAKLFT